MKSIKKILVFALAVIMLVATVAFVGCESGEGKALKGSIKIVVTPDTETTPTVFEVELSNFTTSDHVDDVINHLADEGKICYKGGVGAYGMFLEGIGVPVPAETEEGFATVNYIIEQDATSGKYLYIYTSVEADQNDGVYKSEIEYNGVTLVDSLNGVSSMTIEDGAIIYFTLIVWG